jgi:hypothetical protein
VGLSRYFSQSGKREIKTNVFPLLARLSYQGLDLGRINLNFGLGIGAYIFNSTNTTEETEIYVLNTGGWKKGDVNKYILREHFTSATPGGEGSIGFAYKLSSSVTLGITGRLILISKIENTLEYTTFYKTNWDPSDPELVLMKSGEEFGGIGWGMGASLSF